MTRLPPGFDNQSSQSPSNPFSYIPANQHGPSVKPIGKGSLITFQYSFWVHDPYPLVIVTDILNQYIRGVNLHYLTFNYFRKILQPNCDNPGFSYHNNVKQDKYIVNAFRTYKRQGIRQVRKLDCSFLLNVLGTIRSFDPGEVENMRKYVRQQLQQQMNPKADQITAAYSQMYQGQQKAGFQTPNMGAPPT